MSSRQFTTLSIQTDPKGGIEIDNIVAIKVNGLQPSSEAVQIGLPLQNNCLHKFQPDIQQILTVPSKGKGTIYLTGNSELTKYESLAFWPFNPISFISSIKSLRAYPQVMIQKQLCWSHVSPREEDLCETICSLNFATRVKSVHLGNDQDTIEAKEQKEVAMADLQQEMKHIEDERIAVRSDIEKLNKKLENLTGTNPSSKEQLEAFHSLINEQLTKSSDSRSYSDSLIKECSQDASETDFKSNGLREQERAPGNSISQKKSESTLSSCSQRTKRVLAVPIPERKHKTDVQSKADEKVQDYVYTKQEVVNHDKLNNLATTGAVGKPISEVVIEKPLKMLRDLFNEDSRSDVTTPLQTTAGETTIQIQHSVDGSLTGDSENDTSFPPDECSPRLEECEDGNGVNAMSTTQAPEGKIQSSDCFLLKNSGCSECYTSELYTTSVCSKRDSGVSFSMSELKSCCQQAPTESNMEDSETQGFYSFQPLEKETRHGLLQLKSQRALFTSSENHEDLAVPFGKPEGKVQNTGICHVVMQKIEILCSSALLGLGLYNLGFDHDFFYGLML
ncbi:kinesin-like protein KIN-14T isoform X2 [Populus alba x Populus x berolinensis]|uniref:Kinesin-like protein KIN-14T isoform X2 n=1 Tax=Populus alba x Populus x berolinensis TaxID=444605 RepID=A0AAD6RHW7_9ROSI|nr:kinesin-like protein KIN-14T isoform X2 [Populus alba x Populus x berolinensis]